MRPLVVPIVLAVAAALAACKSQETSVETRPVRTDVVQAGPIDDDHQAVGEVKPRYESELSFRVTGKVLARLVDVGATVKQGDILARLDTQDYENRLRSAEAEVASADATLVEAQATESRQSKLLKDGWTPKANYDSALRNLRSTEARLTSCQGQSRPEPRSAALHRAQGRFRRRDHCGRRRAGQNVAAGQMIVKLARPGDKDGVFNVAETVFAHHRDEKPEVIVWPLSNPELKIEGQVREISPVADATTRTYTVKVTLKNPADQLRLGMSLAGRVKGSAARVVQLPLSALFEKEGRPAVWLVDPASGGVTLRPVTVARYETDTVIIASGLARRGGCRHRRHQHSARRPARAPR